MSDTQKHPAEAGQSAAEQVVSTEVKVCRGGHDRDLSVCSDDTCPINTDTAPTGSDTQSCACTPAAVALAEELYRQVTMGADSYIHILPHIEEAGDPLKTDITAALCYYEKLAAKIADRLTAMGGTPSEEGKMTKTMAHMGISINAMKDRTRSHIAEMLVEGCTMSVTGACRLKRELEDANKRCGKEGCSSDVEDLITLCQGWAEFEEAHIERLKEHL